MSPAWAQQQTSSKPAPAEIDMPEEEQADVSQIEFESIIRVEVDTKQPNYRVPWNIGGMGSGV
ncbi:MAG: hypothetical protein KDM64_04450, partial [Verrucomicrobiae bacterium]|nr:hypothetical protein [Verrucomicrobiae bacterium]